MRKPVLGSLTREKKLKRIRRATAKHMNTRVNRTYRQFKRWTIIGRSQAHREYHRLQGQYLSALSSRSQSWSSARDTVKVRDITKPEAIPLDAAVQVRPFHRRPRLQEPP